jgi:histidinol-phosphate phosphatase family protein
VAQLPELAGTGPVSPPLAPNVCTIAREGTASLAPGRGQGGHARQSAPRPGVLLDRDGTIIVDYGHVGSVDRVELIDGAAQAIARLNRARVPVAVVTNQAGVARGLYDISDVEEVHHHIASLLAVRGAHIDQYFYCPYHPEGTVAQFTRTSVDRKPMPGMARAAAEALNLDLTSSWVVGDRPEDIGLAEAVGASAIHVGPDACNRAGVWSFPSLSLATSFILERIAM